MILCNHNNTSKAFYANPTVVLGINPNSNDMEYSLTKYDIDCYVVDFSQKIQLWDDQRRNIQVNELLEWLLEFAKDRSSVTLLPSSDQFVLYLSIISSSLGDKFNLLIPTQDTVETCIDKHRFALFCERMNIACPETKIIENVSDCDAVEDELFPVIVKPINTHLIPKKIINKIKEINNKNQLISFAEQILEHADYFIVQEKIEGNSEDRFFVGGLVTENRKNDAIFIARKLREIPSIGGTTTHCILEWNEAAYNLFNEFVEKTKYTGLIDFEIMLDKTDNRFKLIEVNPRIGAWHLVSSNQISNISHYYYNYLNNNIIKNYQPHKDGITFMRLIEHFCSLTEDHSLFASLKQYFTDLLKTDRISGIYPVKLPTYIKCARNFLGCAKRRIYNRLKR